MSKRETCAVEELGRGGQGTMYLCTKRSWFRTRLVEI